MRRRTFRDDRQVDIAAAAVSVGDGFGIILDCLGRVNRAFFSFHYRPQLLLTGRFVANEAQFADVILRSFIDRDHDVQGPTARPLFANVPHDHVDVAMVLVKLANLLDVILQLVFIQATRFIEGGNDRFTFGLHLFPQRLLGKMRIAFETDLLDRPFYSFSDRVNDAGSPAVDIDRLNVKLHIDIFAQLLRLNPRRAIDLNFIQHRPRLYRHDHSYAVTLWLTENADILHVPGGVNGADIVLRH